MARGGAIALLLLWSWVLIRDHRRDLPAMLAAAMNAAICCYILVTAQRFDPASPPALPLALGSAAAPALFWLFARAWFNDQRRVGRIGTGLFALTLGNTIILQLSVPSGGPVALVSGALFRVLMFGFATAALWEVWRGRAGDLVEGRRRLRAVLVGTVAVYVALIACAELAVQFRLAGEWLQRAVSSGAVLVIMAFCAAMLRMRQADLFGPGAPIGHAPVPVPTGQDDALAARLLSHMASALPHRDETLSIAALGAQLGEPEYRLRRVINGALGHRNFAQFVNGYRLAEVRSALADPAQREVPIITIALDAGFGSLGPFNRAFRDVEGVTPREWRVARMVDSEIG